MNNGKKEEKKQNASQKIFIIYVQNIADAMRQ